MKDAGTHVGMPGWAGVFERGRRPEGIHPLASVGGPPEHRDWRVGDVVWAPLVHPTALIHAFCTVDGGVAVPMDDPRGRLRRTTTVGARTFLQARVHVGHNAVIGADCEICAGVVVCGDVWIGDGVKIAGNAWVKPLVEIGDGAIIGGGSVVTKDVPAHEVWAGNPARFMKRAWTHPAVRGFEGRSRTAPQYDMTPDQWETARMFAYAGGAPSLGEIIEYRKQEWERDHPGPYRPPDGEPHPDWLRGIS